MAASEKDIHKGHRERVKRRYIHGDYDTFEDHQALELLLFYAYPYKDTNEIAHKLINEYGTLYNLFEAHPLDIVERCGVSEHVAILVSMVPHLSRRYLTGRWSEKDMIDTSKKAGQYCVALMVGAQIEYLYIICLNKKKQVIFPDRLAKGTLAEVPIYSREVVSCVLKHQATAIIIAHNHPSGIRTPSRADIEATRLIIKAMEIIGVEVHDHIIVAGDEYFSFSENRTLPLWY